MKTNTCLSNVRFQSQSQRRGMVLLIVLVLLAAFGITAMTFLLSTGQVKDAAEQNRNLGIQTFSPEALLHNAVMQVIRGSNGGGSEITTQSLLGDMYGDRTKEQEISLTYAGFGKGMMKFTGGSEDYVGRVITNIDESSPFYLRSTTVMAFADGACYCLPSVDGTAPTAGSSCKYILNDLPFQGTLDYDAPDENNKFLALRDPATGDIKIRSFRRNSSETNNSNEPDADNDGKSDSSWIDLGMPDFYTVDGRTFKPMFAIVVEDLDGRLNVNACGGDDIDRTSHAGYDFCGLGRSTSEISLSLVSSKASTLFTERNGKAPDKCYSYDVRGKWFRNISDAGDANLGSSPNATPLDIVGTYCVKVGTNGVLTYGVKASGNSSSIQNNADLSGTSQLSTSSGNPGDLDLSAMNIAGLRGSLGLGSETDSLFSLSELQALLCPYDFEAPYLSHRLKDCISEQSRYEVTTQSWDLAVVKKLDGAQADSLPEIRNNMAIDLLRIANFTSEENVDGSFTKRRAFAKTLYNLLTKMNATLEKKQAAQWAINVVDYFDRDSVITSFEYETGKWVYGCEKPELLIAETLALHNRATETDAEKDGQQIGGKSGDATSKTDETVYEKYKTSKSGKVLQNSNLDAATKKKVIAAIQAMPEDMRPDGKEDSDQWYRPEGALFVNLYCTPSWAGYESYSTTGDLYSDVKGAVNLSKVAGADSVWRIVVINKRNSTSAVWNDATKRDETGGSSSFSKGVERVFNFGNSTTSNGVSNGNGSMYVHSGGGSTAVARGKFAVVGPDAGIAVGEGVAITSAKLAGSNATVLSINGAQNGQVRMSLTEHESYGTYQGPGDKLDTPRDCPIDADEDDDSEHSDDWEDIYATNELHKGFRIIHLQRLANPNKGYDANENPYITVDSAIVDLNTYSAYSQEIEMDVDGKKEVDSPATMQIISRVRTNAYRSTVANTSMIWSQNTWNGATDQNQIAAFNGLSGGNNSSATATHVLFGRGWNDGSNAYPFSWNATDGFMQPVPLLLWLNRVPLSPMELLNVPKCSNTELLASLKLDDIENNQFENASGLSGHLPNFSTDEVPRKILGYFRVPSLQIVTPMVLNKGTADGAAAATFGGDDTVPFACYSMFREPGRVNLNTVCSERVFASLMGRTVADNKTLWTNFTTSRGGQFAATTPFRTIAEAPEQSILRLSGERGLFNVLSSDTTPTPIVNVKLNPYFRYYPLYRLGNLATVRSNVFAVWITMALFEKDSTGTYNTQLGLDTGDLKQYRAFYIIDRTIPVGFVRGKDFNADQTILYRRFLQ